MVQSLQELLQKCGAVVKTTAKLAPFVSKGSTAIKQASNLTQKLSIEQVRSMPEKGEIIKNIIMNDSRWLASDGWVKMQQFVSTSQGKIVIHYVYNTVIKIADDFKIVNIVK